MLVAATLRGASMRSSPSVLSAGIDAHAFCGSSSSLPPPHSAQIESAALSCNRVVKRSVHNL